MLAIVAIYALLAATFVLAKVALGFAHPFFLIGTRMSLAGAVMILFLCLRSPHKVAMKKEDILSFIKISFFHIYLAFSCEFWALQSLSSSKTNLIYTSTPFIAAAFSYFLLGERLSLKKFLGLGLGLLGLLPVMLSRDGLHFSGWLDELAPEIILLVAVVSASYAWFDIKKMMQKGYSMIWINGFSMLLSGIACLATSWALFGSGSFEVKQPIEFIKYVALMILVSNIIFYNAYGWMMRHYSITFLTFAGFLSPIFGAIYGKIFLNESIHAGFAISLIIITVALYIFYLEELKGPKLSPSPSDETNNLEHPPESS